MSFEALLIDLDGVIVDSQAVVDRVWRHWAALHGLDPEPILAFQSGRRSSETIRAYAPHLDIVEESRRILDWECEDTEGVVALPGAHAIFSQTVLPVCIVTSGDRRLADARLAAVGLLSGIPIVTGDEVTNGKPAPDPYVLGASRVGAAIRSCLVIEDAPAGIESGRRAGATVCALRTTHPDSELTQAHLRAETLATVMTDVLGLAHCAC
jgi:mannitol-1-/sugar-/sorbitol-6-phosphatase